MTAPERIPKVGDTVSYNSCSAARFLSGVVRSIARNGNLSLTLENGRRIRGATYGPTGTAPHSWRWP